MPLIKLLDQWHLKVSMSQLFSVLLSSFFVGLLILCILA